jgi:uncharacterized protein YaaW (UPF0174 family)
VNEADLRLLKLLSQVEHRDPDLLDPLYERHAIIRSASGDTLIQAIRLDGSNTLASTLRGGVGVGYDVIVRDVARRLKLAVHDDSPEVPLERAVLDAVLGRLFDNATPAERAEAFRDLDSHKLAEPLPQGRWVPGSLQVMIHDVGAEEVSYVVQQVVARAVGYGVAREAAKRLASGIGLAVPLLNVAMIGWTIWDLSGPAFRKTMPTVVEVALLRLRCGGERRERVPR